MGIYDQAGPGTLWPGGKTRTVNTGPAHSERVQMGGGGASGLETYWGHGIFFPPKDTLKAQ